MTHRTNTIKRLGGLCLALGLLATPGAAEAKTYTLKGKVAGDADGTVSLKAVTSKSGKLKRLKAFRYANLDGFCDRDDQVGYESPDAAQTRKLRGSTKVYFGGAFQRPWYASEPQRVEFFGKVRKRGRRITARGTVRVYFKRFCKAEGKFTVKRK